MSNRAPSVNLNLSRHVAIRITPTDRLMIEQLADRMNTPDLSATVRRCVTETYYRYFPPRTLGYIRADLPGDTTDDAPCARCLQELGAERWFAVHEDGSIEGPLCDHCAGASD